MARLVEGLSSERAELKHELSERSQAYRTARRRAPFARRKFGPRPR